jgi:hypothetical protein
LCKQLAVSAKNLFVCVIPKDQNMRSPFLFCDIQRWQRCFKTSQMTSHVTRLYKLWCAAWIIFFMKPNTQIIGPILAPQHTKKHIFLVRVPYICVNRRWTKRGLKKDEPQWRPGNDRLTTSHSEISDPSQWLMQKILCMRLNYIQNATHDNCAKGKSRRVKTFAWKPIVRAKHICKWAAHLNIKCFCADRGNFRNQLNQ